MAADSTKLSNKEINKLLRDPTTKNSWREKTKEPLSTTTVSLVVAFLYFSYPSKGIKISYFKRPRDLELKVRNSRDLKWMLLMVFWDLPFFRVVAPSFKQARPLWTDWEFHTEFNSGTIVFLSSISSSNTTSKVWGCLSNVGLFWFVPLGNSCH